MDISKRILGAIGIPSTVSCSGNEYIEEVPKLLSVAEEYIIMTTGLSPKFYRREEIKDAFKKTVKKGVDVDIITDKEGEKNLNLPDDKSGLKWLKDLHKKEKIRIYVSKEKVSPHIIVVDSEHVRKEGPHDENIEKTHNHITYYAGVIADFNRVDLTSIRNKSKLYEEWNKKGQK